MGAFLRMVIRKYKLHSNKIARQYRIALLSDFHNCRFQNILKAMPDNLDLILMPGDFCIRYFMQRRSRVIPFIQELCKRAPVYCSMGNHDKDCMSDQEFRSMLNSAGATALINESCDWNGLHLSGWYYIQDGVSPESLYQQGSYNILLSHKPEWYTRYLQDSHFDLVLSGHAHGGQWNLFGKAILASGQGLFPKYVKGLYEDRLLVTTGVSNPVLIPRIGNPREIVLIELQA